MHSLHSPKVVVDFQLLLDVIRDWKYLMSKGLPLEKERPNLPQVCHQDQGGSHHLNLCKQIELN